MSMYDYKGFRVLAMGKMPRIDKYVLGWDHSLKGYISDYAELHQQMMPAAETLNLKMHKLGLGELAVETFLSASTQGFTKKHVTPTGRRKLRTYITNLKDLYPTDLTKGGLYNPDEIHSEVHADSPFKLRPELIRKNHSRICADIGLAPEKPRHYLMYEHENQDQNLVEVRKICRNMMKLVTVDTMDKICKLLSTMPKDDNSETVASKCRAVCAEMQAEGMNMRLLGHMRRGISPDAAEDMQVQLRHILLHEMVARILKVSFHKVLREANGFRESETPLTEQLKNRVKGVDIDRDEDLPDMGRVGPKDPSNEACRVAICKFLNAALSRPYTPPVVPPIRNTLIEGGMDTNKVEEVLSLTRMIQEMKAYNRIHHPSGTDAALAELKKELITVVKVAIPGMTGVLENMAKRKAEEEAMRLQRELRLVIVACIHPLMWLLLGLGCSWRGAGSWTSFSPPAAYMKIHAGKLAAKRLHTRKLSALPACARTHLFCLALTLACRAMAMQEGRARQAVGCCYSGRAPSDGSLQCLLARDDSRIDCEEVWQGHPVARGDEEGLVSTGQY